MENKINKRKIRIIKKQKVAYDIARKDDHVNGNHDFLTLDPKRLNNGKCFSVKKHLALHPKDALLIGIELELESCSEDSRSKVIDTITKVMPELRCVHDGSLASYRGIEINTLPISESEFTASRVIWHKLLNILARMRCQSHDSGHCGLHIHINRGYLPYEGWRKIEAFILKNKSAFIKLSRRTDTQLGYCKFSKSGESGYAPGTRYSNITIDGRYSSDRYHAVNITINTCEFRFFRGTLLPQSFIGSIESIILLCKYFKEENPKRNGFKQFSKWLMFQDKHPFGRIMLQGIIPEYVPRHKLTAEEKEARKIRLIQAAATRKAALQREIEYLTGSNTIINLWVNREYRYSFRDKALPIEQITVPVTFFGRLKKSIKESFTTITLNVVRGPDQPKPISFVVNKRSGWGHSSIARYIRAENGSNYDYCSVRNN